MRVEAPEAPVRVVATVRGLAATEHLLVHHRCMYGFALDVLLWSAASCASRSLRWALAVSRSACSRSLCSLALSWASCAALRSASSLALRSLSRTSAALLSAWTCAYVPVNSRDQTEKKTENLVYMYDEPLRGSMFFGMSMMSRNVLCPSTWRRTPVQEDSLANK